MILQNFYPVIGGAEKQAMELSRALQRRGVEVGILTASIEGRSRRETIDGIKIRRLGLKWGSFFRTISFFVALLFYLVLNRKTYDVVHSHLASSHSVAGALAGRFFGKTAIIKIGGGRLIGELSLSRKTVLGRLKRKALARLQPIFLLVSSDQRDELRGDGLDSAPWRLVPNGVDLNRYRPASPVEIGSLRAELGWKGFVFLFMGRFSAEKINPKFFELFITVWKSRVAPGLASVKFVGTGPLEQLMRSVVQKNGLNESFNFLGPKDEVGALYRAADCFFLPSSTEGLSNSLLEALASGLPVLASRVAGITDLVEDGVNGFLFDPTSAGDIERGITRILGARENFQKMGKASVAIASLYGIDDVAAKMCGIYDGGTR